MKQKDLSKAIEEGIVNGFWKPIFYAVIIFAIMGIILACLNIYGEYKYNKCIEDGICQPPMASAPSCFPLKNLHCEVIGGNETETSNIWSFNICGYQEANAYFEQIKPELEDWLNMDNHSWKIKWLRCE